LEESSQLLVYVDVRQSLEGATPFVIKAPSYQEIAVLRANGLKNCSHACITVTIVLGHDNTHCCIPTQLQQQDSTTVLV
jgi:hypothetical protein